MTKKESIETVKTIEVSTESKEVVSKEETVEKKLSKEELKAKIRRGRLQNPGRLYIDPKYQRPGKTLRIVSLKPGRKEYLESIGYTHREDIIVNGGSLAQPHAIAGQFEAGINVSTPSIIMEIDSDLLAVRQEVKSEDNSAMFKNRVKSNQRLDQQK